MSDEIAVLLNDWLTAWNDGRDERNVYQRTLEVLHGKEPGPCFTGAISVPSSTSTSAGETK
jgi:hypothetical protein